MARHWVLVGLMGAGKSTIGARLAARTGREFIDNDAQLLAMTGRTAAEVQAEQGRAALHRFEREALIAALAHNEPAVIAGAASVVDDRAMKEHLRGRATVVWLDTPVDELVARVMRQTHRPLAGDPRLQLDEQRRERAAALRDVADVVVSAEGSPDEIVDELLTRLETAS